MNFLKKVFGQLVMLGFDITALTPSTYQPGSLPGVLPLRWEILS